MDIHTKHLSIGYKTGLTKHKILHNNLNVHLKRHNLTCILGPNGTGKTTFLRTLAGLLKPLSGEVTIENTAIQSIPPLKLSTKVSVVLTDRTHDLQYTVYELVAMGRYPYISFSGRLKENDHQIVSKAIRTMKLQGFEKRRVSELSDGERQKVFIAKALAQETDIIILDEPTAFLDYPSKIEMMQLLVDLANNQGKTILTSTHDLEVALRFANNIWLMRSGKPLLDGTPNELINNNSIGEYFNRDAVVFDKNQRTFVIQTHATESNRMNNMTNKITECKQHTNEPCTCNQPCGIH